MKDVRRVFGRPLGEGFNLALVVGGLLGVVLALCAAALFVSALFLPGAEAVIAAACGLGLAAIAAGIGRLWLRTFRSEAERP